MQVQVTANSFGPEIERLVHLLYGNLPAPDPNPVFKIRGSPEKVQEFLAAVEQVEAKEYDLESIGWEIVPLDNEEGHLVGTNDHLDCLMEILCGYL